MTLYDFILQVATLLGDDRPQHEFVRFTKRFLIQSLNAGLAFTAARRPDLFTEFCTIPLRAGTYQDARPFVDRVFEVVAQTDANGNILKKLEGSRAHVRVAKSRWDKPSILAAPTPMFQINSATLDATVNGRFTVTPPIPPGEAVFVRVKGFLAPKPLSEADLDKGLALPGEVATALPYFILAQAALLDQDVNTNRAHLTTFASLLDIADNAEKLQEAGDAVVDDASIRTITGARV